MGVWGEKLVARLDRPVQWPHGEVKEAWNKVNRRRALRHNDKATLRVMSNRPNGDQAAYLIDPLPRLISRAYSDLLFKRIPVFKAGNEADQDNLDETVEENLLGRELRRSEDTCASEGEVYWRVHADPTVSPRPIITWYSRLAVVPHWSGSRLVAVAFISRLDKRSDNDVAVYRHFEVVDAEDVVNVIYRGTNDRLGERTGEGELEQHAETQGLMPEWRHELPRMPAGRIVNDDGEDAKLGASEFDPIEDMLLELNETLTTGAKNRRLTAKKRAVVPASALNAAGELPDDQEVLVAEAVDEDMGGKGGGGGGFRVLEYSFDAAALILYQTDLAVKSLSRVGITAQWVGVSSDDGFAPSGTSLRLRLIPAVNSGEGKGQYWQPELPRIMEVCAALDSRPVEQQGLGNAWTAPEEPPSVEIHIELPRDEMEEADRHATLVTAKIESRFTAVQDMHPEWDDDQVQEELDRIDKDAGSGSGGDTAGGGSSLFDVLRTRANGNTDGGDAAEIAAAGAPGGGQ